MQGSSYLQLFYLVIVLVWTLLLDLSNSVASNNGFDEFEAAVEDRQLEQRLVEEKIYFSKRNDTLTKVAYKLYNHRTWWRRIVEKNPRLGNLGPEERFGRRYKIKYMAPRLGATYVIRENDTLGRISEWKYGSSRYWKNIYLINKAEIINPAHLEVGIKIILPSSKAISKFVVPDKQLLERLTKERTYTTQNGDTLKLIAYRLYGHKSWWMRIKKLHVSFKHYKSTKRLPVGISFTYKAPHVGKKYIVKKGDTLSRISQWKYGTYKRWKKIYKLNQNKLTSADLIYPGDSISFTKNGELQHRRGKKLVSEMKISNSSEDTRTVTRPPPKKERENKWQPIRVKANDEVEENLNRTEEQYGSKNNELANKELASSSGEAPNSHVKNEIQEAQNASAVAKNKDFIESSGNRENKKLKQRNISSVDTNIKKSTASQHSIWILASVLLLIVLFVVIFVRRGGLFARRSMNHLYDLFHFDRQIVRHDDSSINNSPGYHSLTGGSFFRMLRVMKRRKNLPK